MSRLDLRNTSKAQNYSTSGGTISFPRGLSMAGGYKLRALGRQAIQTSGDAEYFWVLRAELASCRPSGS